MKHFITTLLSALALSVSGLALAGAPPVEAPVVVEAPAVVDIVEAPVVVENPAVQNPVQQEVVETEACDPAKAKCDTDETADATEIEAVEEVTAS